MLDGRLAGMDGRLAGIERSIDDVRDEVQSVRSSVSDNRESLARIEGALGVHGLLEGVSPKAHGKRPADSEDLSVARRSADAVPCASKRRVESEFRFPLAPAGTSLSGMAVRLAEPEPNPGQRLVLAVPSGELSCSTIEQLGQIAPSTHPGLRDTVPGAPVRGGSGEAGCACLSGEFNLRFGRGPGPSR